MIWKLITSAMNLILSTIASKMYANKDPFKKLGCFFTAKLDSVVEEKSRRFTKTQTKYIPTSYKQRRIK